MNKKIVKKNKERIEGILENASTVIIGTDTGIAVIGDRLNLMSTLSSIINKLKKGGMSESDLNIAFKVGMKIDASKFNKKNNDEIDDLLSELLIAMKKDIENILGDDTDE